jgi:hypothetical protein
MARGRWAPRYYFGRTRPAQANDVVSAAALKRGKTMAKTYRDVAIDQMIASVEKAMSHVIDWWATRQHRRMKRLTSFAYNLVQQSIPSNL